MSLFVFHSNMIIGDQMSEFRHTSQSSQPILASHDALSDFSDFIFEYKKLNYDVSLIAVNSLTQFTCLFNYAKFLITIVNLYKVAVFLAELSYHIEDHRFHLVDIHCRVLCFIIFLVNTNYLL